MKKRFFVLALSAVLLPVGVMLAGCGGHKHDLKLIEAQLPTCTEAGHTAYYTCDGCDKIYQDKEGKTEIALSETVLDATGHDYEYTYNAEDYTYEGVCLNNSNHTTSVDAGSSAEFAYQVSTAEQLTAVLARESSATVHIRQTGNITMDLVIADDKEVSYDLNGYTLTNNGGYTITNNGTLTITDSSTDATGTVDCVTDKRGAVLNNVGAELTINGGNYTRSNEAGVGDVDGGNSWYVVVNHGTATINDGHIYADGSFSSLVENGFVKPSENTTEAEVSMTINGGTLEGGLHNVKNDDYGVLTVNGGRFVNYATETEQDKSDYAYSCILNWNLATINGGTFVANQSRHIFVLGMKDTNVEYENSTLTIVGGTAEGEVTYGIVGHYSSNPDNQTGVVTGLDSLNTEGLTVPTVA